MNFKELNGHCNGIRAKKKPPPELNALVGVFILSKNNSSTNILVEEHTQNHNDNDSND